MEQRCGKYVENPLWVRLIRATYFPVMIWRLWRIEHNLPLSIKLFHHWVWYEERPTP